MDQGLFLTQKQVRVWKTEEFTFKQETNTNLDFYIVDLINWYSLFILVVSLMVNQHLQSMI